MAAGLPLVATDAGGMAEQVESGVTGLLVSRDDVTELSAALLEAASDPIRLTAWGEAGRIRASERFGLERMVANYQRVCLVATDPECDAIPSPAGGAGRAIGVGLAHRRGDASFERRPGAH
jgi:hypothetical protein